jgi:hypothetical protein
MFMLALAWISLSAQDDPRPRSADYDAPTVAAGALE